MATSIRAAITANSVLKIAVTAPSATEAGTYTTFGGDDLRRGVVSFEITDTQLSEEKVGYSKHKSYEQTARREASISAEFRDNELTAPLFWGDKREHTLWYQFMPEAEASGRPLMSGAMKITSLGHQLNSSGLLDWSVAAVASNDLTTPTQGTIS